ncbi:MAG: sodium:calcium antiporter [archaeon]|nr:sodium:calcium antiporter [archaeon]
MLFEVLFVALGAYLMLKGAEWVTDSSIGVAKRLGTTRLAVGLILISVMLSLPELLVALSAFFKGHEDLSVGVSIGSVIVNLGLILGITALIRPIKVPRHVVTRDGVFMLIATIVVALIALEDLKLTQRDGLIFLLLFIPYVVNVYEQERQLAKHEQEKEVQDISKTLLLFGKLGNPLVIKSGYLIFFVGFGLLLAGSELFTQGLLGVSKFFSVSDVLVGVTVGALGPSLPNLVVAIQASRKGFDDIVVSQSIGSNIFTLFVTLGILATARTIVLQPEFSVVTLPALLVVTVVSFVFLVKGKIGRLEGAVLVLLYLAALLAEIASNTAFF